VRRGEQSVDDRLVSLGTFVRNERVQLLERRRQTGEIQRDAPEQRFLPGFGRRRKPLALETRQNERVDRVPQPGLRLHGRRLGPHDLRVRPVPLVPRLRPVVRARRARIDPVADHRDLLRRQRLFLVRHARRDLAEQALHERAVGGLAGLDHGARQPAAKRARARVEAQPLLAPPGPMAA
jgi:hypothetical protein